MDTIIEGQCLCGKVRFRLRQHPHAIVHCHCIDCRRASGAPFVTWGTVLRSALTFAAGHAKRIAFAGRLRSFAPCCGTPLTFEESPHSATIDISIATLEAPERFPPEAEIWTEDRLPWIPLNPNLAAFPRERP